MAHIGSIWSVARLFGALLDAARWGAALYGRTLDVCNRSGVTEHD
jgi:hypothetical protein